MTTSFSTAEALETLCKSVPEWTTRLDELNGQIAFRQIELARLTESERPPTRSIKNKGSTESLRPKDGNDNPFLSNDAGPSAEIPMNPFDSPQSNQNGFPPIQQRPNSSTAVSTPLPLKASSTPQPLAGIVKRQVSQPTPPGQTQPSAAVLRKRKTGSVASGESLAPKYRTRSMIIVYYDSAVQTAFEDLVKFISGSRNAMRRGKMAAKMIEMRRAAELEVGDDDEDEDDGETLEVGSKTRHLIAAPKPATGEEQGQSLAVGDEAEDSDIGPDLTMAKLRFMSTRQMGRPAAISPKLDNIGSTLSIGLLRGYRRGGDNAAPDIFDELDKGLEWSQGQCEHAAHQFLRDGECGTEIANIKRKLAEVKEKAEKEIDKLKLEDKANSQAGSGPEPLAETKGRVMKSPLMRREVGVSSTDVLEADDSMEVDDDDTDEPPPKLLFKRSRDIGQRALQ